MTTDWPNGQEFWHNRRVMGTVGNGFLGKNIVCKLHERGADVFVVDIDPSAALRVDLRPMLLRFAHGD